MHDWIVEKLDRIKEFGSVVTSGFIGEDISEKRYNICLKCEHLGIENHGNSLLRKNGCDICKCYMPAKVLFKDGNCPKRFWPEELLSKEIRIGPGVSGEGTYSEKKKSP